jgi:hypothetical protein
MEIERQIPLGVLTYQRSDYLNKTLESFFKINYESLHIFKPIVVMVQGMDLVTSSVLGKYGSYIDRVINLKSNHGCAWGYTLLNQELMEEETDLVMHLQDDWLSTEPLINYLDEDRFSGYKNNKGVFQLFEERKDVGYVRLRSATWSKVSVINRISRKKIKWNKWATKYNKYSRLVIGNAHYTFNPTIIRTSVLRRLLPVTKEQHAMEKYHKMKLLAAQLRGNCFMHIGDDRAVTKIGKKEKWIN